MQEPIIKKKPKQEPSPFSKNIQAYIFANNLNRQDFADLINAYMAAYPDRGKIYSNNDVWTYERRGSLPKDMRALVAIAKIMGKPLEEVLTTVIPAEQFAPPRLPQPPVSARRQLSQIDPPIYERARMDCCSFDMSEPLARRDAEEFFRSRRAWNIERLKELTEEQREFVYELVSNTETDDDGEIYAMCDVVLRYKRGRYVEATLGSEEAERIFRWDWLDYGKSVRECDDESEIIENKLESEFLKPFCEIGLLCGVACNSCPFDDMPAGYEGIDGYFIATFTFAVNHDDIIAILEQNLAELQGRLAELRAKKQAEENAQAGGDPAQEPESAEPEEGENDKDGGVQ